MIGDYDRIPPNDAVRKNALWVRRFLAHHEPPIVTEMDNGTIMLEWYENVLENYVSIEIGETRVGILVRERPGPSWYINGKQAEK